MGQKLTMDRKTAHNSTFAIGGVSCSADSFVVKGSSVLRINICAEKPAHRKSAKRYFLARLDITSEPIKKPLEKITKSL
jgi:hypothetical protein